MDDTGIDRENAIIYIAHSLGRIAESLEQVTARLDRLAVVFGSAEDRQGVLYDLHKITRKYLA